MNPKDSVRVSLDGGNQADHPRSADGGADPESAPSSPSRRYCWQLECGHSLLSDEPALVGDNDYCPGCGMNFPIVDVFVYRDEDVSR